MTLREFLESRHACNEFLEWLGGRDLQSMWEECPSSYWMVSLLHELEWDAAWEVAWGASRAAAGSAQADKVRELVPYEKIAELFAAATKEV